MSPRSSSLARALLCAAGLAAACGGNVVVDPIGGGGDGGAPPTPTSASSATSNATSSSSGVDVTATTTTGPMPDVCDGTGFCGDGGSGCVQCALEMLCVEALEQCQSAMSCFDYVGCVESCADVPTCIEDCVMQFPEGAGLYGALIDCVVCDGCPLDCNGVTFGDPFPGCPQ